MFNNSFTGNSQLKGYIYPVKKPEILRVEDKKQFNLNYLVNVCGHFFARLNSSNFKRR